MLFSFFFSPLKALLCRQVPALSIQVGFATENKKIWLLKNQDLYINFAHRKMFQCLHGRILIGQQKSEISPIAELLLLLHLHTRGKNSEGQPSPSGPVSLTKFQQSFHPKPNQLTHRSLIQSSSSPHNKFSD